MKPAKPSIGVRNYTFLCFGALIATVPLLLFKGMDLWSLFPLIVGALALLVNWRLGPLMVILALTLLVSLRAYGLDPSIILEFVLQIFYRGSFIRFGGRQGTPPTPFLDALLSLCVVVFVAGHYRLQGLVQSHVPPEARAPATDKRLKPRALAEQELVVLLTVAFSSTFAGVVALRFLYRLTPALGISPLGWQALVFIWLTALASFCAWSFFGYLSRHRATPMESLLYLQDLLWRQTRREQSRMNRWLTWAHLRWQEQRR